MDRSADQSFLPMGMGITVRWLSRVAFAAAIIMIGWGLSVILIQPVTAWFAASATVWMALLLGWFLGGLVFVQFILRAASVQAPVNSRESWLNIAALMFIRVYVGLMFVPHFCSHILGGPYQFRIYTLYFASLGLHTPAIQVLLAGAIELITAIGLVLGLFTRPVALLGSVYLLMSMLWGKHFQIGYVWALPDGGYEFGVFWAVMIAVFVVLGGGPLSVDNTIRQSDFRDRWPWLRAARFLFV
jgi:uncharacterized membrane protein YphA (DoxX/SURF4 family)